MAALRERETKPALRGASPRVLPLGLVLAAALHASAIGVAALTARELLPAFTPSPTAASEPLHWIEDELEPRAAVRPEPATAAPVRDGAGNGVASAAAAAAPPRLAAVRRPASGAAPPSSSSSSDDEVATPPGAGSEEAAGPAEAAAEQGARAPALSLEALGVGKNPFLTPPAPLSAAEARAELGRRIDHVLRAGLAKHDQELGLGPEGPAVAKVTELVMQSSTRPNTNALLSLRTDGSGEVVHVEVAEASGDTGGWNAIAAELLKSLRGRKLRVPSGTGGVTMQLRVDSRVQLPSGADPGLAIDMFGQEIKKGEGERSTRVQLLQPKLVVETFRLSKDDPRTEIPVVGLSLTLISVLGDPVDIGAPARRVVHAHLVSMETHPLQPADALAPR